MLQYLEGGMHPKDQNILKVGLNLLMLWNFSGSVSKCLTLKCRDCMQEKTVTVYLGRPWRKIDMN